MRGWRKINTSPHPRLALLNPLGIADPAFIRRTRSAVAARSPANHNLNIDQSRLAPTLPRDPWAHPRRHLAHRLIRPRRPPLTPLLHVTTVNLQILKHVWILEHLPPRRYQRLQPVPHHPLLARILEEKLLIDQPAVHDVRHHVPVTPHHPHVLVLVASR